jgi:hypothetical protein
VKQAIVYKEWLPDAPEVSNQGLITAKNALPMTSGYAPFLPLATDLGTVGATTVEAAFHALGFTKGASYVYAAAGGNYWMGGGGGAGFSTRGAVSSTTVEKFAQFEGLVISAGLGHVPNRHTVGAASNFATLNAAAPIAGAVGVIGQFLVLGNLLGSGSTESPASLQWSAVGDAANWPPPSSSTAIATQSGEQEMPLKFGPVIDIHGGDQYGIVLQTNGVSRMTYVGPPTVFQFDVIDSTKGSYFLHGAVQVGRLTYFISAKGFCVTDGVTVQPIGDGKVDEFFWDNYFQNAGISGVSSGYDPVDELVYWSYPTTAPGTNSDTILIFNPRSSNWTYATQTLHKLVSSGAAFGQPAKHIGGFNVGASSSIFGRFNATAGSAVFATGDMELNPGGRTWVDGIKPSVESTGTAPAITARIGFRDDLSTAPSYTSAVTATAATGFSDFRVDARYVRAEVTITGNFRKVSGFVASFEPSSDR